MLNDHIYQPSAVIHRYAYMLWFRTTRMNTLTIIVMATVRMQAALNDHIFPNSFRRFGPKGSRSSLRQVFRERSASRAAWTEATATPTSRISKGLTGDGRDARSVTSFGKGTLSLIYEARHLDERSLNQQLKSRSTGASLRQLEREVQGVR